MTNLPSLDALKAQAKSLRAALAATGHPVSHAQSLELLAKQLGLRDWNTLCAKAGDAPRTQVQPGQQITGRYMGCAFTGKVIRASDLGPRARQQITVRFDQPVNISKFDSMVVERRQVIATINHDGATSEKRSDGTAHMVVTLP